MNINFNISSLNSSVDTLKDQYATIKDTLDKLLSRSMNLSSSEQPSYHEDVGSSHIQAFHSNHPHHKLHLLRVEVNKFDGLDPTCWVTQMEHYFSLHGIADDLSKIRYGILYLDLES